LIDQVAHVVVMAHVSTHELGLPDEGAQLFGQRPARIIVATGHDDPGTFMGEGQGGSASDACECAGDQDNR